MLKCRFGLQILGFFSILIFFSFHRQPAYYTFIKRKKFLSAILKFQFPANFLINDAAGWEQAVFDGLLTAQTWNFAKKNQQLVALATRL